MSIHTVPTREGGSSVLPSVFSLRGLARAAAFVALAGCAPVGSDSGSGASSDSSDFYGDRRVSAAVDGISDADQMLEDADDSLGLVRGVSGAEVASLLYDSDSGEAAMAYASDDGIQGGVLVAEVDIAGDGAAVFTGKGEAGGFAFRFEQVGDDLATHLVTTHTFDRLGGGPGFAVRFDMNADAHCVPVIAGGALGREVFGDTDGCEEAYVRGIEVLDSYGVAVVSGD